MNGDLIYGYLFDMEWFFLITCAVMVAAAGLIVLVEDIRVEPGVNPAPPEQI